ncbi:MAG: hypothetical protein KBF73_01925 [Flavobacteriales bacterium]|nr:hypothetical protein [Flavobacteriales bacterium]
MNKATTNPLAANGQSAKEAILNLLAQSKVGRIVVIDDVVDRNIQVEEILGIARTMTPDQLSKFTSKTPEFITAQNIDELREKLREWDMIAPKRQTIIRDLAAKIVGAEFDKSMAEDYRILEKLRDFVGDIELHVISPTSWIRDKELLMKPPMESGIVLCLFDQDLSKCIGFGAEGGTSGIGLLKEVVSLAQQHVVPGILSHNINVTGSITEIEYWRSSATNEGLSLSSFLPISKKRLAQPEEFASQLKVALVNQLSETIKEALITVYFDAVEEARRQVKDFDVYNFNHIVMHSSFIEGVSEMDTFVRVVDIIVQKKADDLSIASDYRTGVQILLNQMRSINAVDIGSADAIVDDSVRNQLRHDELYVSGDVLNKSHAPLQCGDIFQIGTEWYILLAQPCDLMVRSSGDRELDQKQRNLIGPLLPISGKAISLKDHRARRAGYGFLQYLAPNSSKGKQVEFDNQYYISIGVLDLSVFSDEGACKMDLSTTIEPPASMHYPWVKRHQKLTEEWKAVKERIEESIGEIDAIKNATIQKLAWDGLLPSLSVPALIQPDKVYGKGVFNFGISRVLRLKEPEASSMLRAYMQYLAREAKDHDFAKV